MQKYKESATLARIALEKCILVNYFLKDRTFVLIDFFGLSTVCHMVHCSNVAVSSSKVFAFALLRTSAIWLFTASL